MPIVIVIRYRAKIFWLIQTKVVIVWQIEFLEIRFLAVFFVFNKHALAIINENTANIFKNVSSISKEAIDICYASVSQDLVAKAAQQIAKAKRVYIFATADSYLVGLFF